MSQTAAVNPLADTEGGDEFKRVLVVLVLLPLLLGVSARAFSALEASDRYGVDLSRALPAAPRWPGAHQMMADLKSRLENLDGIDIFEPNLGLLLRQHMESSPWVRRVTGVRRVFPCGLELDLEFADPHAAVFRHGRFQLLDSQGEILPMTLKKSPVRPPFIVVGTHETQDRWYAEAVREGVAVLNDLESQSKSMVFGELVIETVNVSNFASKKARRKPEITLGARPSTGPATPVGLASPLSIGWGRSSHHRLAAVELSPKEKIQRLEQALRARPALRGVATVDVRFDRALINDIKRSD